MSWNPVEHNDATELRSKPSASLAKRWPKHQSRWPVADLPDVIGPFWGALRACVDDSSYKSPGAEDRACFL
jgi:hypothetical protein